MDDLLQMMRELTEAPGVPGQERAVRDVMARYLSPGGELMTDNLGSVVAYRTGSGVDKDSSPRVLLAGHMDEVGFLVTRITDEGFLNFQPLGGWWEQVMLAQRVVVKTHKGDLVGVFGSKPPHLLPPDERKKMVEKHDMFIDIGVLSKDEAVEVGVRPGDPVIPICPFTVLANEKQLLAKAWDNRVGCALAVAAFRDLGDRHPNTVYAGATVQEEVGLRGAQTLGNLVKPDVALSLDVSIAGDTPGVKPHEAQGKLGKGPVIMIYDGSLIPNLKLRNLVVDVAEQEKIPYQFDSLSAGGTDGGRLQLAYEGVPTITLSVASRYIHSAASMINLDDFENGVKLLVALVNRLDSETVAELKR